MFQYGEDKKDIDVLFSVGEAFASICGGWTPSIMCRYEDVELIGVVENAKSRVYSNEFMAVTVKKLTRDFILGNPGSEGPVKGQVARKAAAVWLLSLVKFCDKNAEIRVSFPCQLNMVTFLIG